MTEKQKVKAAYALAVARRELNLARGLVGDNAVLEEQLSDLIEQTYRLMQTIEMIEVSP